MTPEEFERAIERHKFSERTRNAARMVLVEGVGFSQSAKKSGLKHRQSVYRAVVKLLKSSAEFIRASDKGSGPGEPNKNEQQGRVWK